MLATTWTACWLGHDYAVTWPGLAGYRTRPFGHVPLASMCVLPVTLRSHPSHSATTGLPVHRTVPSTPFVPPTQHTPRHAPIHPINAPHPPVHTTPVPALAPIPPNDALTCQQVHPLARHGLVPQLGEGEAERLPFALQAIPHGRVIVPLEEAKSHAIGRLKAT